MRQPPQRRGVERDSDRRARARAPRGRRLTLWLWLAVALLAAVAFWLSLVIVLLVLGRREDARATATFVPDCAVLFKRLLHDRRVPRRAKLLVVAVVPYLASPIDLIPDFIPVVGQLDDAIVVAVVLRHVVRRAGRDVIEELWPGPERGLQLVLALSQQQGSDPSGV